MSKRRGAIQEPAAIGAVIDLGFCLNLMDGRFIDLLANEHELLCIDADLNCIEIPSNSERAEGKLLHRLDCAVIEHLHARIDSLPASEHFESFDSVRGLFTEGGPAFEVAGFSKKTRR